MPSRSSGFTPAAGGPDLSFDEGGDEQDQEQLAAEQCLDAGQAFSSTGAASWMLLTTGFPVRGWVEAARGEYLGIGQVAIDSDHTGNGHR